MLFEFSRCCRTKGQFIKREVIHFQGLQLSVCRPSEKRSTLQGKNMFPGVNASLLERASFHKGIVLQEGKHEATNCLPYVIWRQKYFSRFTCIYMWPRDANSGSRCRERRDKWIEVFLPYNMVAVWDTTRLVFLLPGSAPDSFQCWMTVWSFFRIYWQVPDIYKSKLSPRCPYIAPSPHHARTHAHTHSHTHTQRLPFLPFQGDISVVGFLLLFFFVSFLLFWRSVLYCQVILN